MGLRYSTPSGVSSIPQATLHGTHHKPCFTTLPIEIKHMIYKEFFRGSSIMYCGQTDGPDPDAYAHLSGGHDEGNILLASKQCRAEAIRLYYQSSHLSLFDGWTVDQTIERIPELCRKNVRSLSCSPLLYAPVTVFWHSGSELRTVFPNVREIYPPVLDKLELPNLKAKDKIMAEARTALTTFPFQVYEDHKTAWAGLKVYHRFYIVVPKEFLVDGKEAYAWQCEPVQIYVECASKTVLATKDYNYPWFNENTTLADLVSRGHFWRDNDYAKWRRKLSPE